TWRIFSTTPADDEIVRHQNRPGISDLRVGGNMPSGLRVRGVSILLYTTLAAGPVVAQNTVGGHMGLAFPIVSTTGDHTTTINHDFSMAFPIGISIKGSGRMFFDLEFVPVVQDSPRNVSFIAHPGLLWGIGHGFSAGGRLAFDVNSSTIGFT